MDIFTILFIFLFTFILYKLIDYFYHKPRISKLDLVQKRIFITGCDTGFGHDIARRLDKYGMHVFAGCLTEEGEANLKWQCSDRLTTIPLDVSKPESVRKAFKMVAERIPDNIGLWALINNAGIMGKLGPEEWMHLKDYREVFDINLLGLIDMTMTFLPLLKTAKGRIINTASMAGRLPLPLATPYCISKYGVECFTDALRFQLKYFGISVHIAEPGFTNTNIISSSNVNYWQSKAWQECPEQIREEYGGQQYLEAWKQQFQSINHTFRVRTMFSNTTDHVVNAYSHAVTSLRPRRRYECGSDAKYFFLPLSRLPACVGDLVMNILYSDNPKPMSAI